MSVSDGRADGGGSANAVTALDARLVTLARYDALGRFRCAVLAIALRDTAHALLSDSGVRTLRQVVHRVVRVLGDLVVDRQEVGQHEVVTLRRVRLENHQLLTPVNTT